MTLEARNIDLSEKVDKLAEVGLASKTYLAALSVLTLQISDARFRTAIVDIRDRVITGESFTDLIGMESEL